MLWGSARRSTDRTRIGHGCVGAVQAAADGAQEESFGWTSFPGYDRAWANALERVAPHQRTQHGGRAVFLNVTDLTGQRVDGHALGETMTDCLHVRPPR